jgi:AcrR family transcriptional regulator
MARPPQPLLSRDRIIEVAASLIDAEGLQSVSIRRLAIQLGVSGPSLYHHVATKDDILDAVVEDILLDVDVICFGQQHWRDALATWARSYRAALAAHPNVVPYLARGPGRRPSGLAIADAVHGGLTAAGWPPARATHIGAMLRSLVIGSALSSFAAGFDDDPRLYADRYPHLHQAHRLAEHREAVDQGAFELGLATMLDGLDRIYADLPGRPGNRRPPPHPPCEGVDA